MELKVGMRVLFGRGNGEQTEGEITKVNGVKCKVKQMEARGAMKSHPVGTIWTVPASLMTAVGGTKVASTPVVATPTVPAKPKRTNAEIMLDIQGCYNQLSPENLHCDGEISRSQAARKAVGINARLRELFAEIGRKVTEDEAWSDAASDNWALTTRTDDVGEWRRATRAPAKACPFKTGDKVCFTAKGGTVIVGYVRTLNVKTVTVDPIGGTPGRYWKVGPSLLRAA